MTHFITVLGEAPETFGAELLIPESFNLIFTGCIGTFKTVDNTLRFHQYNPKRNFQGQQVGRYLV